MHMPVVVLRMILSQVYHIPVDDKACRWGIVVLFLLWLISIGVLGGRTKQERLFHLLDGRSSSSCIVSYLENLCILLILLLARGHWDAATVIIFMNCRWPLVIASEESAECLSSRLLRGYLLRWLLHLLLMRLKLFQRLSVLRSGYQNSLVDNPRTTALIKVILACVI
jgi:hypothetical protein